MLPCRRIGARATAVGLRWHSSYDSGLHENPYTAKFKVKPSPDFPKQTTGLTGLFVSEHPHHELSVAYGRILRVLDKMPDTSVYKQHTKAIVTDRLNLVKSEPDIEKLEQQIGMGQIEEVIEQAEYELATARTLFKYNVWEPLIGQAPQDQWRWPI